MPNIMRVVAGLALREGKMLLQLRRPEKLRPNLAIERMPLSPGSYLLYPSIRYHIDHQKIASRGVVG